MSTTRATTCWLTKTSTSPSAKDIVLSNVLREKGSGLAGHTGDEKMRRFFWGLGLESKWAYVLPLANAILEVFGVEQGWDEWKVGALKRYGGDGRLKALVEEPGKVMHFYVVLRNCQRYTLRSSYSYSTCTSIRTCMHTIRYTGQILGGQGLGSPQITIR
jgi:hypothetical protein